MRAIIISIILCTSFISFATEPLDQLCPGDIRENDALMKTNRTNVKEGIKTETHYTVEKDVCYKVTDAKFVYLVDKNHAVYSIKLNHDIWPYTKPQLFLFEHQDKFKWRRICAIVKGTGIMVDYKTGEGFPRKMPLVKVISENKKLSY